MALYVVVGLRVRFLRSCCRAGSWSAAVVTPLGLPYGGHCELIGVRGVFERQSSDMIHVRVSRIDLLEFAPNPARLFQTTQLTQR